MDLCLKRNAHLEGPYQTKRDITKKANNAQKGMSGPHRPSSRGSNERGASLSQGNTCSTCLARLLASVTTRSISVFKSTACATLSQMPER
eukprot:scaffold876_cov243-Pinguiococcus_pyrenoidosus.AAC.47